MAKTRAYTTQLQAGLGMIHETLDLLRLWCPGDGPAQLADRAIASGTFSRTTARRTRNIVAEMFAPRFLGEGGKAALNLKQLVDTNQNQDDLTQLFFLYTARAQAVFADFVTEVYWPRYSSGASSISRLEAETFIYQALDGGKMQKRWTQTTIRRVSAYLLGCCADFGLISESGTPTRTIGRFAIRPNVAIYLAHDLHFVGMGDLAITRHPDWHVFGLEPNDVTSQIKNLAHNNHFIVQATTDLVQIAWKYRSMEECIRAISQR
jgi:hypothetical protein